MTSGTLMGKWYKLLDEISPDMGLFRPAWYESWLEAFENQGNWQGRIINFTGYAEGSLHTIFPACVQKFGPLNFISLAGNYFPIRYFPSREMTPGVGNQLMKQFSSKPFMAGVRMGPVTFSEMNITLLVTFFKQSGWGVYSRDIGNDFILLTDESWKIYEGKISRKRRQNLRYYWKKLSKTGDVRFSLETDSGCSEWADIFISLADVEKQAWLADRGDYRFFGARNQTFWNSLVQDEWFRQSIKVWRIIRNQETISFALTFDVADQRFVYANSYIESVSDFSTGSEIYFHLIKEAFENGIKKIHFGLGDSGYKTMWGAQPDDTLKDLIFFPPNLIGKCASLLARSKAFTSI